MTSMAIVAPQQTCPTTWEAQIQQEIEGYEQFAESLRSVRRFVARNLLVEAQDQCKVVVTLAESLQRMAFARGARDDSETAPKLPEKRDALPAQYLWLRDAQARARRELAVTLTVLSDLHDHTAAVLSALQGQSASTYDEQARRR